MIMTTSAYDIPALNLPLLHTRRPPHRRSVPLLALCGRQTVKICVRKHCVGDAKWEFHIMRIYVNMFACRICGRKIQRTKSSRRNKGAGVCKVHYSHVLLSSQRKQPSAILYFWLIYAYMRVPLWILWRHDMYNSLCNFADETGLKVKRRRRISIISVHSIC